MLYAVRALFNITDPFWAYKPEHRLNPSAHMLWIDAEDPQHAAEETFILMNRDDRPNGANERSLSVGDVLLITANPGLDKDVHAFSVASVGFKREIALDIMAKYLGVMVV